MRRQQEQQSRAISELCSLVLGVMRPLPAACRRRPRQVSTAEVASLLLGVSVAMMLCGWVTFLIGFILMPWVLGLSLLLFLAGVVSNLPGFARWVASSWPHATSPKEMHDQVFSKLPVFRRIKINL